MASSESVPSTIPNSTLRLISLPSLLRNIIDRSQTRRLTDSPASARKCQSASSRIPHIIHVKRPIPTLYFDLILSTGTRPFAEMTPSAHQQPPPPATPLPHSPAPSTNPNGFRRLSLQSNRRSIDSIANIQSTGRMQAERNGASPMPVGGNPQRFASTRNGEAMRTAASPPKNKSE